MCARLLYGTLHLHYTYFMCIFYQKCKSNLLFKIKFCTQNAIKSIVFQLKYEFFDWDQLEHAVITNQTGKF